MSVVVRIAPLALLVALSTSCAPRRQPAAATRVPAPPRREAILEAGLKRLRGDADGTDVSGGAQLLRRARELYASEQEPLVLGATLALIDRLEASERGLAESAAAASRDSAARAEEIRTLRRTIAGLRQQIDKRDEALRKAAVAALGPSQPH